MTQLFSILLGGPSGGASGGGNPVMQFIPLVLIIVVFYFFMIRPQMKRQKEAKLFRESLKRGDNVISSGGIYGKITEVGDTWVNLEISNNVIIKVDKASLVADVTAK